MYVIPARRGISILLAVCLALIGIPLVGTAPVAAVPVDDGAVTSDLNCVTFVDASTGFAAGASGVILKTTNAGASWSTVRSGGAYDFRGISFANASTGWVITVAGQVFKTTNGGVDWNLVATDVGGPFYVLESFYDIDFWDAESGFAGGGRPDGPPMVARGDSGGSAWGPLPAQLGSYDPPETEPPYPRDGVGYFYGLDVRSSAKAWVCGQDVFKTPTLSVIWAWDGAQWTQQPVSGTGRLLDIAFGTDTAGAAVGDGGMVRYTTNGGTTWSAATPAVTSELDGVDLLSTGRGWMVGLSGEIWRTDTYGSAWTEQTSGTFAHLLDVAALSPTAAVAVGRGGTILRTTDGVTWKAPAGPPVVNVLDSSSHMAGEWVSNTSVDLAWAASGDIDGYGFVFDQSESTNPSTINTTQTNATRTATASGVWYAHVAAHDTLGRWSPPKHRQVLVDTTDPLISDDADPAGYTVGTTINLSATDAHSGIASITYSIDGAPNIMTAGSVAQVSFPSVGEYVLTYSAMDNAGNSSALGSATVTVNPPAAPVMSGLSSSSHALGTWGPSSSVSLVWSASGTGVNGYGLAFDQNPSTTINTYTTAGTTGTRIATSSGIWYAHVAARDTYGQWSATRHLQVLVDSTKPLVDDDVDPLGYDGSATVILSATDAHSGIASIDCTVSGVPTHVDGSSLVITKNAPGTYPVTYSARDAAGNLSEQGEATIEVRALIPDAPLITSFSSATHPLGVWGSALGVSLAWSASGTGLTGYGLAFDQTPATAVGEHTTVATTGSGTATGSGVWYAHVAALDSFAQWSATRHLQVLVDNTKPVASDDVDPAGYTQSATVNLSAIDAHAGVASIAFAIDGVPAAPVADSVATVEFPSVGEYVLTYTAQDNAGNVSLQREVTVRVNPPTAPVMTLLSSSSHSSGQWDSALEVALQWDASGSTALVYGVLFDDDPTTVVSDATVAGTTPSKTAVRTAPGSGTWYAHVAAKDTYGQWSPTRHLQVLVDQTKPIASDDADPLGYEGSAAVILSATDADSGVARIEYKIDDVPASPVFDSVATVAFASVGTYALTYRAYDLVGNESLQGSATIQVRPELPAPAYEVPISGSDRYLTAIEACNKTFGTGLMSTGPDGHRTVVIASGENWPDALSAAGLAGAYEAPLLLTRRDALPSSVSARLATLGADKVFIVGGAAAVNDAVKNSIDAIVPGSSAAVERVSGATRYETAADVAAKTLSAPGRTAWDGTAFVATGGNFPDALAAGPLAAAKGLPMYLARPTGITAATLDAMVARNVTRVYVLGGTAAVSDATVAALRARGISLADRWAGTTRYATAAAVAENSLLLGLDALRPALATGTNYPDALAGGVMQGAAGSVVVLTNGTSLSIEAADVLSAHRADVRELRFLGGTAALSLKVRSDAMFAVSAP